MTENKKNLKKPAHKLSNVTSVQLSATYNECTVSQNNCTPGCSCGNPSGGACASASLT